MIAKQCGRENPLCLGNSLAAESNNNINHSVRKSECLYAVETEAYNDVGVNLALPQKRLSERLAVI